MWEESEVCEAELCLLKPIDIKDSDRQTNFFLPEDPLGAPGIQKGPSGAQNQGDCQYWWFVIRPYFWVNFTICKIAYAFHIVLHSVMQ